MNNVMLLFIGGSMSPTEFKVSYFPFQRYRLWWRRLTTNIS